MTAAEPKGFLPRAGVARWPLSVFDAAAPGGVEPAALRAGTLRLGVLSNANSGHNRRRLRDLEALARHYPHVTHLATGHGGEVRAALREFAGLGIDVLAINGGDGTIARVLGETLEGQPFPAPLPVALLPGGTANMTADRLGVRGSLPRAARRLFAWTAGNNREQCPLLKRPILRVRFADGRDNAYGMFLGAGAVIQGTEYAHREVHARGLRDNAGLAVAVARTLWGLRREDPRFHDPVRLSLEVDGERMLKDSAVSVVLVTTLDRLFLGVKPFWGAGSGPVRSTVIATGARGLLRNLPGLLSGRGGRGGTAEAGYHSHRGHRLRLSIDGSLNIDGEIHRVRAADGPVCLDAGGAFSFLRL
jgi:hypothetical protein